MSRQDKILDLATSAGCVLLESGAEVYRVEDTICRICYNFKMDSAESFCMPTGIFTSATYENKNYTKVIRIKKRSTDLAKIDMINQLSRDAINLSVEEFEEKLNYIINFKHYSLKVDLLFAALGAFGFTLIFEGTLIEALCAFMIGFIIRYVSVVFDRKQINPFFSVCTCSLTLTLIALCLFKFNFINNYDNVIVGSIMLLVPGLAITNALRDTIAGDLVSGITRGAEAFLTAVAVALGSGMAMSFWIMMGGIL